MLNGIPDDALGVQTTKEELLACYVQYLRDQHHSYFHTLPGSNPGNAASAVVEEDSLFEAEHVNGILRHLIGSRPALANSVSIFPVFNMDAFFRVAQDAVVNKLLSDPQYKHLVKDKAPIIEISECDGSEILLAERENAIEHRNWQDQEINNIAASILEEMEMNPESMLSWHLEAIALNQYSLLGNIKNENISFVDCSQFIIPFRKNGCHYTVAVVNCYEEDDTENRIAEIEYYDSMDKDLDESSRDQLISFFHAMHFDEVYYSCVSKKEQKDGHNCGIFASFKAFDIVNENLNLDERLLPKIIQPNEYNALFNYFRNFVVELLRESGCNISLSLDLAKTIQLEQDIRNSKTEEKSKSDNEKSTGFLSWLGGTLGSVYDRTSDMLGYSKRNDHSECKQTSPSPREQDQSLGIDQPPRTLISNHFYDIPSATFIDLDEEIDKNSDEEYDSEEENDSEEEIVLEPAYKKRRL